MSRSLFLRGLGFVYLAAFLSLEWQVGGLFGAEGLRPIRETLTEARATWGSVAPGALPSVFWLGASDAALRGACWVGAASALLLIGGLLPLASLIVSWALYLSFVVVGAPFLSYQWDALLLETGFLAIFWAPTTARLATPLATQPSPIIRWLLWWLLFRLLFFSGWVKLASGDTAWWDLSALSYHYESQPLPTWTAWYAHHFPGWLQRASVVGMFVIELVLPLFLVLGRRARTAAAAGFLGLQILIGATGNYGFFGLLTVVLCIPLLEDETLLALVPRPWRRRVVEPRLRAGRGRTIVCATAAAVLLLLTVPGAFARLTGQPLPGAAVLAPVTDRLRPFRFAGSYGLFAVMTRNRPEILLEGSADGIEWHPYVFRSKPGPLGRAPGFVQPDMPRLDWQMWFDGLAIQRALQTNRPAYRVVTPSLIERLREGSTSVRTLLGSDPFAEAPPRHLRWTLYDYRFTDPQDRQATGNWWTRRRIHGAGPP